MEYSFDDVVTLLRSRELTAHAVRPKDRNIYKAKVYEVFWLVYDNNDKVVLHYYVCSKCNVLIYVNLSKNGNSKLRRHKCFTDYSARLNDVPNEVSNVIQPTEEIKSTLARALSEYGDLCKKYKGKVEFLKLKSLIPNTFSDEDW